MNDIKDMCYLSMVFLAIGFVAIYSFQKKGKQRNHVLASRAVLQDLFDEANVLLRGHPHLASRFAYKIREFDELFRKTYHEIHDRSMDICWKTKKKEVCVLERSLENVISEINIVIRVERDELAEARSSDA